MVLPVGLVPARTSTKEGLSGPLMVDGLFGAVGLSLRWVRLEAEWDPFGALVGGWWVVGDDGDLDGGERVVAAF